MKLRVVDPELPSVPIRLRLQSSGCNDLAACRNYSEKLETRLLGKYFSADEPFDGQVPTARIDLEGLTYPSYIATLKKLYKGNVIRDARKADREGFVSKPFNRRLYLPDLVEINQSMAVRSGGPMRKEYLKTVEEMGGYPAKKFPLAQPGCPHHFDLWWGCFAPIPGHQQGEIQTDEKLIAYIDFRRVGDLAIYSLIIGHGDYLKYGIMYRLHFSIMEWLLERADATTKGIKNLMYAGFYQGSAGLQLWKKKVGFSPCYLILHSDTKPRNEPSRHPTLAHRIHQTVRSILSLRPSS